MEYLQTLFSFAQNNVLYFYFVPLAISALAFLATSITEYKLDIEARTDYLSGVSKGYTPKIKIGTLVGRAIIAALPFINIGSAIYKMGYLARDIKLRSQPLRPKVPHANLKID
jgi:hypothetical protein